MGKRAFAPKSTRSFPNTPRPCCPSAYPSQARSANHGWQPAPAEPHNSAESLVLSEFRDVYFSFAPFAIPFANFAVKAFLRESRIPLKFSTPANLSSIHALRSSPQSLL